MRKDTILIILLACLCFIAWFALYPVLLKMQNVDITSMIDTHPVSNDIPDTYLESVLDEVISEEYSRHVYVPESYVCLDSVINMWDVLYARGIHSTIMVGNKDRNCYDFDCANHAWLLVKSENNTYFIETTQGRLVNDSWYKQGMRFEDPASFKNAWAVYYQTGRVY